LVGAKVEEGLSPRTIRGIRAVLRSALSDAVKWRVVPYNAAKAASLPRAKRVETRVFTPEQARTFVAAAGAHRLGPVFSVALAVGLRLGEALGLRWMDVDLERSQLHVRQALQRVAGELQFVEPKSEQSRRTIALPEVAAKILKRHRTAQLEERLKAGSRWTESGLVFTSTIGTPLDDRNVRRAFTTILRGAELPTIRIHDLRHTCASLLLVQGVHPRVVMETLGHSQISLTLDTYSHVLPALQQDAARQMDSLLAIEG
jgi:integrase